jgi:tRNA(Ile)-lysidine synthetase-like protein
VVRSRRPGDAVAARVGSKRVDELLSEWAVPRSARGSVPVVEDADGIVAVLASSAGGRDRYRAGPSGDCARRLAVIVKGA